MTLTRAQRESLYKVFNHHRPVAGDESADQILALNGWSLEKTAPNGPWAWTHPDHGPVIAASADIVERYGLGRRVTYREFRRWVQLGHDCIMVHVSGIWIGVEPDGHAHS